VGTFSPALAGQQRFWRDPRGRELPDAGAQKPRTSSQPRRP
jgi:hypothetical protein